MNAEELRKYHAAPDGATAPNYRHTPGPWEAGHYSSVVGLPVMAQPDKTKNTIVICGVRGDRHEAEANARLIAAAPDLLSVVQDWLKVGNDLKARTAVRERARAAIAKATGQ